MSAIYLSTVAFKFSSVKVDYLKSLAAISPSYFLADCSFPLFNRQ